MKTPTKPVETTKPERTIASVVEPIDFTNIIGTTAVFAAAGVATVAVVGKKKKIGE